MRTGVPNLAFLIVAVTIFVAQDAGASVCEFYKKNVPALYRSLCKGGSVRTKPAGANSSFSDSFNLNTGSLPTEPSSYGLETIGTFRRESSEFAPNFAIVKGFRKFGAGVSTSGNNTFYGNDVAERLAGHAQVPSLKPREPARGNLTNLNLGTALELYSGRKSGFSARLGLSARYNKTTDSWGGGPALLAGWNAFTFGVGVTRERVSNYLPRLSFASYLVSLRLWIFEFEYDVLSAGSEYGLKPIHILTTTASIRRLILTAAVRRLDVATGDFAVQHHFAIQYLLSQHVAAGFLFNYIPGGNSLGIQIYL